MIPEKREKNPLRKYGGATNECQSCMEASKNRDKAPLDRVPVMRKVRKDRHIHEETEILLRFFLEVIKDYGLDKFYEVARSDKLRFLYDIKMIEWALKDWFEEE